MFDKILGISPVQNIPGFWIVQQSEYVSGSECARVLDIPGLWMWFGFEYDRILNIPKFCICHGYTGLRICLNKCWICLNMSDLLWFKWKWVWKICKYLCKHRLIAEAFFHSMKVTVIGMTVVQILENPQESNHVGVLF